MVVAAQNTNNSTIRSILLVEKLTGSNFTNWYRNLRIVLSTMSLSILNKRLHGLCYIVCLQKYNAFDMMKELKTISKSRLNMNCLKQLKHSMLANKTMNYSMHSMGKTVVELRVMLKLYEKGIPKKAKTPTILAIQEAQDPRDNLAKDSVCHHCHEVGHWRRNCPSYHAELKKRKNASIASTSGMFTIELYAFPNKTWVYDTSCGTHICNTSQGLRGSRKLKHRALSLYVGNGIRAAVEVIGSLI
ncbi:zinc finger, CCHC-type containing protein, partial [Tanacetum coccineum]